MPEKPEVLTVVSALKTKIIGKTIKDVLVRWDNIIASPSVLEFKKGLVGKTIRSITTRGKFIIIFFDEDALLIHLRMEGKFFFRKKGDEYNKHEHIIFTFEDDEQMRFHDVRKFGKMYLIPKKDVYNVLPLKNLGMEFDDKKLNGDYLMKKFARKRLPIKTVLLDQSIIAGIGNIYADEILYLSHINPLDKAYNLDINECNDIVDNTRTVLSSAIKLGGTTIKSFTSSEGVHGLFQNELHVHGKTCGECPTCGGKILKIKIGGRGTYYCPCCQKSKEEKNEKNENNL